MGPAGESSPPDGLIMHIVGVTFSIVFALAMWLSLDPSPQEARRVSAEGLGSTAFSGAASYEVVEDGFYKVRLSLLASGKAVSPIPAAAACPVLIAPDHGAVLDNGRVDFDDLMIWDFDWSDCPGATAYQLEITPVEPDEWYTGETHETVVSSYHEEIDGWTGTDARTWRVRARLNGVWGAWSGSRKFTVEPVDTDPPASQ